MKTLSLSELKDALTAQGVSTATESLRGEARRDELAKRLHQARVASGQVAGSGDGNEVEAATQGLGQLSLSELRSALELRQISTQTPGLKGEARRHALNQRLMNAYSNLHTQRGRINTDVADEAGSGRVGSSDKEVDETKSEASSSVYSTTTDFIFYDSLSTKRGADPELQPTANALTPQLSFTKLKRGTREAQIDTEGTESSDNSVEHLQRELFELRTKLHTARQEQQRLVDHSLQKAGIQPSLSEISTKLQALERERRRLQGSYFGHELVKCEVLSSANNILDSQFLELLQEDALVLIEKHQDTLKRLAERTKEAMAVAKFQAVEIETGMCTSARQEEHNLLEQIGLIESSLSSTAALSPKCRENSSDSDTPILAHCRSTPHGLRHALWDQMDVGERRQLHVQLRSAASFHIRRDRVPLENISTTARAPTPADKLGMKALFMEKAKRNVDEILEVYKKALKLDDNHAENLGSYALFLCTSCGQSDDATNYFQRAIAADPTNAKNLANYANFLMRERKEYAKSEELYKRALKIAPKDVNIMGGYADLLAAKTCGGRENLLQARRVLKKALAVSPLHTNNQLRLALVLVDLKENEFAERCFEQLLAVTKQQRGDEQDVNNRSHAGNLAYIYEKYAHFLHQGGHWARAKRMYDEALALDPQRPSLLRNFSIRIEFSARQSLDPEIYPTTPALFRLFETLGLQATIKAPSISDLASDWLLGAEHNSLTNRIQDVLKHPSVTSVGLVARFGHQDGCAVRICRPFFGSWFSGIRDQPKPAASSFPNTPAVVHNIKTRPTNMKFFSVLALLAIIAQYTEAHQMLRSDSTKSVDFSDFSKPRDGKWDGKMRDGSRGGRHSRHPKGPINGKRRHGSHPSIDGGKNGRGKGERKTSRSDPTKEQSNE